MTVMKTSALHPHTHRTPITHPPSEKHTHTHIHTWSWKWMFFHVQCIWQRQGDNAEQDDTQKEDYALEVNGTKKVKDNTDLIWHSYWGFRFFSPILLADKTCCLGNKYNFQHEILCKSLLNTNFLQDMFKNLQFWRIPWCSAMKYINVDCGILLRIWYKVPGNDNCVTGMYAL